MKTIDEILDTHIHLYNEKTPMCAQLNFTDAQLSVFKEAMQEHAKQCCDLQIINCAENFEKSFSITLQIKSIRNTPNVVTKKP